MSAAADCILKVALDAPLRKLFDYRPPQRGPGAGPLPSLRPGTRLAVPFGRRQVVGVLVATSAHSEIPPAKLKCAAAILDDAPLFDVASFDTLLWAADYYHHPIGEVFASALPQALRRPKGKRGEPLRGVADIRASPFTLTAAQAAAVAAIEATLGRYQTHVLFGATGSGKTEIYLRVIATAIASGGQALVLVPEIALTPQLVERFTARFGDGAVAVLHSGLRGTERRDAWLRAQAGSVPVLIGTRSAVFTPLPQLAVIIVDEEHDGSFKQQEGFRYSARDVAVVRASRAAVPVVLGSATPSLETLHNADSGRYARLDLARRPVAEAPLMRVIDLRAESCEAGLAQSSIRTVREQLDAGGQVIMYLNRRGFAPALYCTQCGWTAPCPHCDARMTLHRRAACLRCHHCGAKADVPLACAQCQHPLQAVGQGTERVEAAAERLFPGAAIVRLDRDAAARADSLAAALAKVRDGEARILIGTQMLTKGHDFPEVGLVLILDADQGLFASDFRAAERLAQTITQVAGRAGRAQRPGEVLIQTQFPEHPLLKGLLQHGYAGFAASALAERAATNLPPFARLALLRADAKDPAVVERFLGAALERTPKTRGAVRVLGPAPAIMARRADRHRAQLLIESSQRGLLQRFLHAWLPRVDELPARQGLRWSIDVDPLEID